MSIIKSSRHQKIIGDTGEAIICNWLSRSNFEVSIVDHTGIDIVAYNKETKERIGITVKSRTRDKGNDFDAVTIFNDPSDKNKVEDACKSFGCIPWIGVYVETPSEAFLFLCDLSYYQTQYSTNKKDYRLSWNMNKKSLENYKIDKRIKGIKIQFEEMNWSW